MSKSALTFLEGAAKWNQAQDHTKPLPNTATPEKRASFQSRPIILDTLERCHNYPHGNEF
jgi:hypothetical protein